MSGWAKTLSLVRGCERNSILNASLQPAAPGWGCHSRTGGLFGGTGAVPFKLADKRAGSVHFTFDAQSKLPARAFGMKQTREDRPRIAGLLWLLLSLLHEPKTILQRQIAVLQEYCA